MILSYIYKLRPSSGQAVKMDSWLNMLRSHYNWCLADRIETYHQPFIQGAYCHLRNKAETYPLTCCVVKNGATGNPWQESGKKRNAGTIQDAALVELKAARPWYKSIDSDVLQRNIARLNTAYQNFFDGRGFPAFKNRSNFRSFEYKPGRVKLEESKVYLPKIGWMRLFDSRPIPDGFVAKNIKQKAVIEYGLTLSKVRRDLAKPKQLTLFETPSVELTTLKPRQPDASKGSKRRVPGNLGVQLDLFSQDIPDVSSVESPFF